MSSVESPGSSWWREELRRRNDPEERTAGREALQRRLFGEPDSEEPTDDKPDNDPAAAA